MNKYLTPWTKKGVLNWRRTSLDDCYSFCIEFDAFHDQWHSYDSGRMYAFDTVKKAMKHRDNALLKQGFVFLTWEQIEKFKALL